jgi:citrate synthase
MFRGQDAAFLSRHASLEEVARLLWQSSALSLGPTGQTRLARSATPKARGFDFLSRRAVADPPSFGRSQALLQVDAWEVLSGFAGALLGTKAPGLIYERIAAAW